MIKLILTKNNGGEIKSMQKITKAMVLAGGLGTRFLPVTLAGAKELIAIGNKPILMYHLEDLAKAGITDVLIIGNKLKEESFKNFIVPSEDYINKIESDGKLELLKEYNDLMSKLNISYINQDDRFQNINGEVVENEYYNLRGSSIAILAGKAWANGEPFIVVNGDDLCLYPDGKSVTSEILDVYNVTGDSLVYGKEVPREDIYKYSSMVLGDKVGSGFKMKDIIEKPAKGTEPSTIMGFARYLLDNKFFDRIFDVPARKNGEYCMTDVLSSLAQDGFMSTRIFDEKHGGKYFDCGSMSGYVLANAYVGLHNSETSKTIASVLDEMLKEIKKNENNNQKS